MKYRHLPNIVDAEQFWPDQDQIPTGVGLAEIRDGRRAWYFVEGVEAPKQVPIVAGDYLVQFTTGCRRRYKQSDFEALYEPIAN